MGDPEDQGASEQGEARRGFKGTLAALGAQAEHSGFPCAFKHAVSTAANEWAPTAACELPSSRPSALAQCPGLLHPSPASGLVHFSGRKEGRTHGRCLLHGSLSEGRSTARQGLASLDTPRMEAWCFPCVSRPQEPLASRASPAHGSGTWCVGRRLEPKPPHLQAKLLRLPPRPGLGQLPCRHARTMWGRTLRFRGPMKSQTCI